MPARPGCGRSTNRLLQGTAIVTSRSTCSTWQTPRNISAAQEKRWIGSLALCESPGACAARISILLPCRSRRMSHCRRDCRGLPPCCLIRRSPRSERLFGTPMPRLSCCSMAGRWSAPVTAQPPIMFMKLPHSAAREHGSALITADSVRADLAARRGDIPLALQLSEEAFRTVLDGRSRIGQENYKLSFVANSQSVGEQYLRLHAEASVPAPTLLDSIEAWRLQVFKDIYLGGLSSEAPPQRIADALQAALRRDEAYVAYTIGEQWSEAILVSPSAVSAVRLPIDRAGIFRDLAALRHWLSPSMADAVTFIRADRVPPELEAALHDLHDKLISPLGLGSEVRFLAISPDESLAGLPWGALLDPETTVDAVKRRLGFQALRPLYQRLAIAIIPSAQILLRSMPVSTDSTASRGGVGLVGAFEGLSASQKAVTSLPGRGSGNQGLPELGHGVEALSAIDKSF